MSPNARVQRPPANALKCALYRSRSACNEMLGGPQQIAASTALDFCASSICDRIFRIPSPAYRCRRSQLISRGDIQKNPHSVLRFVGQDHLCTDCSMNVMRPLDASRIAAPTASRRPQQFRLRSLRL